MDSTIRYEFSKYSKLDIDRFIDNTKMCNTSNCENVQKWNYLFNWTDINISNNSYCKINETIDISDDEKNISCTAENLNNSKLFIDQAVSMDKTFSKYTDPNMLQYIQEILENGNCLTDDDLLQLYNLKLCVLKNLFVNLNKNVNLQVIYTFSNSLCILQRSERVHIAKYFTEIVLTKRVLLNDQTQLLEKILFQFASHFEDIVCENLITYLFLVGKLPKIVFDLIESFSSNVKDKVSKSILNNTATLEDSHLEVLHILISSNTDLIIFKRIIELMLQSSEKHSSSLLFGKLLVLLLNLLTKNSCKFESDLKCIITAHKTMYRKNAEKILNDSINDISQMSQTQITY